MPKKANKKFLALLRKKKKHVSILDVSSDLELSICEDGNCCDSKVHCPLCTTIKCSPLSPEAIAEHVTICHIDNAVRTEAWLVLACNLDCGVYTSLHYHCPECGLLLKSKIKIEEHLCQKCIVKNNHSSASEPKNSKTSDEKQEQTMVAQMVPKQSIWDTQTDRKINPKQRKDREDLLKNCAFAHESMVFDVTDLDIYRCTSCCSLFHCPLCPPELFRPSTPKKVIRHLSNTHLKTDTSYKGLHVLKCRLDCMLTKSKIGQAHYHCPLCPVKLLFPKRFKPHIDCHLRGTNKIHKRHKTDVPKPSISSQAEDTTEVEQFRCEIVEGVDEYGQRVQIQVQVPIDMDVPLDNIEYLPAAELTENTSQVVVMLQNGQVASSTAHEEQTLNNEGSTCTEGTSGNNFGFINQESNDDEMPNEDSIKSHSKVEHSVLINSSFDTSEISVNEEGIDNEASCSSVDRIQEPTCSLKESNDCTEENTMCQKGIDCSEESEDKCDQQNEEVLEQVSVALPWQKFKGLNLSFQELADLVCSTPAFSVRCELETVHSGEVFKMIGTWEDITHARQCVTNILSSKSKSFDESTEIFKSYVEKVLFERQQLEVDFPMEKLDDVKDDSDILEALQSDSNILDNITKYREKRTPAIIDRCTDDQPKVKRVKKQIVENDSDSGLLDSEQDAQEKLLVNPTFILTKMKKVVIPKPGRLVQLLPGLVDIVEVVEQKMTCKDLEEESSQEILVSIDKGYSGSNEVVFNISELYNSDAKDDNSGRDFMEIRNALNTSTANSSSYETQQDIGKIDNNKSEANSEIIPERKEAADTILTDAIMLDENGKQQDVVEETEKPELLLLGLSSMSKDTCPGCLTEQYCSREGLLEHLLISDSCMERCRKHKSKQNFPKNLSLQIDSMRKCTTPTCFLCKMTFSELYEAKIHYALALCRPKQKRNPHNIPKNPDTGKYYCELCGFEGDIPVKVWGHMERKHMEKDFNCDECDVAFTTHKNLESHKERVHRDQDQSICEHCGKLVFTKYMKRHYNDVHNPSYIRKTRVQGEKLLSCVWCKYNTFIANDLSRHMRRMHGARNEHCTQCPATFSYRADLHVHTKTIHGERNIVACTLCGKRLFEKHLESHTRNIHDNQKDYICGVCGKGLQSMFSLRYHMETHKKPSDRIYRYKCPDCGSGFMNRSVLQDHMNTHTGVRPYHCDMCLKAFRQRSVYHKHLEIHNNVKFMCAFCGLIFSDKKSVLDHKEEVHVTDNMSVSSSLPPNTCVCGHVTSSQYILVKHQEECAMYQAVQTFIPQNTQEIDDVVIGRTTELVNDENADSVITTSSNSLTSDSANPSENITSVMVPSPGETTISAEGAAAILAQHGQEYEGREVIQLDDGTMLVIQNLSAEFEDPEQIKVEQMPDTDMMNEALTLEDSSTKLENRYQCAYCKLIFVDMTATEQHILENHMDCLTDEVEEGSQEHIKQESVVNTLTSL